MERPTVHDIPIELKATLVDADGVAYREFRSSLKPRWGILWAQIAAGYAVLFGVPAGLAILQPGLPWAIPVALLGALLVGYSLAYLNNFFHEAAHHNLLPSRRSNDLITNLLMGWLFASSIAIYREIHWQHHRALGTTMDSENSYFDPLRTRYLLEGLLGLKTLRTLRRYRDVERERGSESGEPPGRLLWTAIAALVNLAILAGLASVGAWAAAVAWAGGVLSVFPFLVSLRQTLEHRAEDADPATDYTQVDHGAVNRLFGDGPLASTLGSAGFNRHALHHWEPQLSCTQVAALEAYLERTDLAPYLAERQTSYRATFVRLLVP